MGIAPHVMWAGEAMEVYESAVYLGQAHRIRCLCGTVIAVGPELGLTADQAEARARDSWANHALEV